MLTRLKIKNFKCLQDVDIPLGPFNVFIGPNDSGKSSAFQALDLLRKSTNQSISNCFTQPNTFRNIVYSGDTKNKITLGVEHSDMKYEFCVGCSEHDLFVESEDFSSDKTLWKRDENGNVHDGGDEYYKVEKSRTSIASYNNPDFKKILSYLQGIKPYTLRASSLSRNSYLEPTPSTLENPQLDVHGYGLPSILNLLSSTAPEDERYAQIKKYLRDAIPAIVNFGITPVPIPKEYINLEQLIPGGGRPKWQTDYVTGQSLYFELKCGRHKIPAEQASDGALLVLGYLTLVYTTKNIQLLFVEEPENGIHPKLLKFIVEILRGISRGVDGIAPVQVIVTTHSPYFLDYTEPEEVFVFHKGEEGSTQVAPMQEVKDIKQWFSDYLLGELWYNWGEKALLEKAGKK